MVENTVDNAKVKVAVVFLNMDGFFGKDIDLMSSNSFAMHKDKDYMHTSMQLCNTITYAWIQRNAQYMYVCKYWIENEIYDVRKSIRIHTYIYIFIHINAYIHIYM